MNKINIWLRVFLALVVTGLVFSGNMLVASADTEPSITIEMIHGKKAVVLNGNSVIIEKQTSVINGVVHSAHHFYIDKNSNGVVDADEVAEQLDGITNSSTTEVPVDFDVYGVYQKTVDHDFTITCYSDKVMNLYGVYEGNVKGVTIKNYGTIEKLYGVVSSRVEGIVSITGEAASTFDTLFYGLYSSHVTGEVAIDVCCNSNHATSFYGAYASTIDGDLDVKLHGGTFQEYVYGVMGGSPRKYCKNCNIQMENVTIAETGNAICGIYGMDVLGEASVHLDTVYGNPSELSLVYMCTILKHAELFLNQYQTERNRTILRDLYDSVVMGDAQITINKVAVKYCDLLHNAVVTNSRDGEVGGTLTYKAWGLTGTASAGRGLSSKLYLAEDSTFEYTNCAITELTNGVLWLSQHKNVKAYYKNCTLDFSDGEREHCLFADSITDERSTETFIQLVGTMVKDCCYVKPDGGQTGKSKVVIHADETCSLNEISIEPVRDESCAVKIETSSQLTYAGTMPLSIDEIANCSQLRLEHFIGVLDVSVEQEQISVKDSTVDVKVPLDVKELDVEHSNLILEADLNCRILAGVSNADGSMSLYYNGGTYIGPDSNSKYEYYPVDLQFDHSMLEVKSGFGARIFSLLPDVIFGQVQENVTFSLKVQDGCKYSSATAVFVDPIDNRVINKTVECSISQGDTTGELTFNMGWAPMKVTIETQLSPIEIVSESAVVESLKTGRYYDTICDLNQLVVAGDASIVGQLTYKEDAKAPLPKGILLEHGIVCGNPQTIIESTICSGIVVTAKNGATATYHIYFNKIERGKGIAPAPPEYLSMTANDSLGQVSLDQANSKETLKYGKFVWPEMAQDKYVAKDAIKENATFPLYFEPIDVVNIDWSECVGVNYHWDENLGCIIYQVPIDVVPIELDYKSLVPNGLTGQYGNQLNTVELPKDALGGYIWCQDETRMMEPGTHLFYAQYQPENERLYKKSKKIPLKVQVKPIAKTVEFTDKIQIHVGKTLADISLPISEDGEYCWLSDTKKTLKPGNRQYILLFQPNDTKHYRWLPNYNSKEKGCKLYVSVCVSEHEYGDGVVVTPATSEQEGEERVVCKICGIEKKQQIPKLVVSTEKEEEPTKADEKPAAEAEKEKTTKADEKSVTEAEKEKTTKVDEKSAAEAEKEKTTKANEKSVTDAEKEEPSKVDEKSVTEVEKEEPSKVDEKPVTDAEKEEPSKVDEKPVTDAEKEEPSKVDEESVTEIKRETIQNHEVFSSESRPENISELVEQTKVEPQITVSGVETKTINFRVGDTLPIHSKTGNIYIITNDNPKNRTVAFAGCKRKKTKYIRIPGTVTIQGNTYKVTSIARNALNNHANVKKIVIGKHIIKIGKKAFYNCKSLKEIYIKSKKLKAHRIGKQAFAKLGCRSRWTVTIHVPDKKFKNYKKLLKTKGLCDKYVIK